MPCNMPSPLSDSNNPLFLFSLCSDVYSKRNSLLGSGGGGGGGSCDIHTSTNTLTSTCTPSTCTTPSSVFVIEEHYDDENYIATEV